MKIGIAVGTNNDNRFRAPAHGLSKWILWRKHKGPGIEVMAQTASGAKKVAETYFHVHASEIACQLVPDVRQ